MSKETIEERKRRLAERTTKINHEAHDRLLKDGTVQFRLDAENMDALLKSSKEKGLGIGVLARMWVMEKLKQERAIPFAQSFCSILESSRLLEASLPHLADAHATLSFSESPASQPSMDAAVEPLGRKRRV